MAAWAYGGLRCWCMNAWRHGHVRAWAHGRVSAWTHGRMDAWTHGHVGTCGHGHMRMSTRMGMCKRTHPSAPRIRAGDPTQPRTRSHACKQLTTTLHSIPRIRASDPPRTHAREAIACAALGPAESWPSRLQSSSGLWARACHCGTVSSLEVWTCRGLPAWVSSEAVAGIRDVHVSTWNVPPSAPISGRQGSGRRHTLRTCFGTEALP
eukprot:365275-Chlamydomonas_euryale.AAC.3